MNRRDAILGTIGGTIGFGMSHTLCAADKVVTSQTAEEAIRLLEDVRQAQRYTDDPIPEADIRRIVSIGCNAPSARNRQPWFFSVVTDRVILAEIDRAAGVSVDGRLSVTGSPLVIFIGVNDSEYSRYDAGAAADRMNIAANILGYGCKTVATAAKAANRFKDKIGVPSEFEVYTALLIGVEQIRSVDGVSGATLREPQDKKVVYIK